MIRSKIAKKIKIRRVPKIIFRFDESVEIFRKYRKFIKKSKQMNGFLLINKPSGLSSNQAVQKIKKIFKVAKVGHLGTLDPLASGQ